jgi:hypothetical protein
MLASLGISHLANTKFPAKLWLAYAAVAVALMHWHLF